MHVQWYEHSSQTAEEELSDPQELFLLDQCDLITLQCIVSKINVHYLPDGPIEPLDFFYKSVPRRLHSIINFYVTLRFTYDSVEGSLAYTDVDTERNNIAEADEPPNNWLVSLCSTSFRALTIPQSRLLDTRTQNSRRVLA